MRGPMEPTLLREAAQLAEQGIACALAVVADATGSVPGKLGATMLVTADGTIRGTVGGAGLEERVRDLARRALHEGRGGVHTFDLARWKEGGLDSVCGGTVTVSVHVLRAVPHLLLVGGGHCALALAKLAKGLDWNVTVVDSRPGYATTERFPDARHVQATEPASFIEAHGALDGFSHAYLLGHSHHEDGDALIALLSRGFPGVVASIGSRAKLRAFRDRALAAGVSAEAFDRVRCPIGVDVGAQTPAEIAVAVAAEIIRDIHKGAPEARGAVAEAPPLERIS